MPQGRLLSPNETKYWLMDYASPMNSVVVVGCPRRIDAAALRRPGDFKLPHIALDANDRPRWVAPQGEGVVEEEAGGDELSWLRVAERLTDVRVGTESFPPWHAVVIPEGEGSILVLAVHHSLTDYRTSLWVAHCLLEGKAPGPHALPCEELLDPSAYGDPEAESLISQWWLARASARWKAIGVPRLAQFLPAPCKTRLRAVRFSLEETQAFERRCEKEGVTLNGAVAVALRDAIGAKRVAHSIDLSRFIKPALEDGPGIAISHLVTDVADGEFWEAARDVRAKVFEGVMAGEPADELLVLPRALLQSEPDLSGETAEITITGGPTLKRGDEAYAGYSKQLVVGSPRAGGRIVILSHDEGRLELISSSPTDQPELPLGDITLHLWHAMSTARSG